MPPPPPSTAIDMSGFQTAEIKTYSSPDKIGVRLPHPSNGKQAKAAIAKTLGLKPQSAALFGLFIGVLGRPNKALGNSDELPVGADFSFSRWCFDLAKEARLCRQDDAALHLLYCEATNSYRNETKLRPSPEQAVELDSFMDPDFPVERQFMELVRTVPGYDMYIVHECTVKEDILHNKQTIPKGTLIQCHLDLEKLAFVSDKGDAVLAEWNWRAVRRWKKDSIANILFEVCLEELNASILKWVSLESRQNNYLFHLASAICDTVKVVQDKEANPLPEINPALAGKVQDPLAEFVNGIFFGTTSPKFSSIPPS